MNNPAADRACGRCRQRRVKCDKRQPGCLRCERFSQPCPGYGPRHRFLDEGVKVRQRYASSNELNSDSAEHEAFTSAHSPSKIASPSTANSAPPTPRPMPTSRPSQSSTRSIEDQPLPYLFPDTIAHGVLSADQFAPNEPVLDNESFFDLDIEEYYAMGNNSCGFIPGLPAVVSEVGQLEPDNSAFSILDLDSANETTSAGESNMNSGTQNGQSHQHKRRREVACLIAHYTEVIAPWLDLFDPECYFAQDIPLQAISNVLLRYALAAMAAKHFGLLVSNKSTGKSIVPQSIIAQNIRDSERIDWFYKAANYYDKAISYLRIYLQAVAKRANTTSNVSSVVMGNFLEGNKNSNGAAHSSKRQRIGDGRYSEADPEVILAAISIFSLYESLNTYEAEWLHHLSGFQSILTMEISLPSSMDIDQSSFYGLRKQLSRGGKAAFWNFAHDDSLASYISRSQPRLDTENVRLWNAVGLQIDSNGQISSGSHLSREYLNGWAIIWILLKVMNYVISVDESEGQDISSPQKQFGQYNSPQKTNSPADRLSRWDELRQLLKNWHQGLPDAFRPYAKIPHAFNLARDTTDSPGGFTKLFFTKPICAASLQMYHFAQILLLSRQPIDTQCTGNNFGSRFRLYRQVSEESEYHSREICGIALGRPSPAVRVNMVQPLYMAGMCLEKDNDRQVVLDLLTSIESDTGYSTTYRVNELRSEWGWTNR